MDRTYRIKRNILNRSIRYTIFSRRTTTKAQVSRKENHKRIAKAVAMDSQMRSLNSVFKKLNKHIQEYLDLDRLRNVAKLGWLKLKTLMHLDFIKHHGTKEPKHRVKAETQSSRPPITKF